MASIPEFEHDVQAFLRGERRIEFRCGIVSLFVIRVNLNDLLHTVHYTRHLEFRNS